MPPKRKEPSEKKVAANAGKKTKKPKGAPKNDDASVGFLPPGTRVRMLTAAHTNRTGSVSSFDTEDGIYEISVFRDMCRDADGCVIFVDRCDFEQQPCFGNPDSSAA